MIKQILYISIIVTTFAFVAYNVLTAEASEKDDKKVCKQYNGEWKETKLVDADGNEKGSGEKQCQFDNEKDQKLYSIRPGKSLDGTGPDGEYGRLDLGMSDEEAASVEDEICDDENADSTDVYGCMSDKRKNQMKDIKNTCDEVGGKMTKDGCETDSDGPKADKFEEKVPITKDPITNEDWRNTVTPSDGNLKIPSTTTKYYDDEDREKQEEEIAEYNKEADESHDGSEEAEIEEAEEADSEEENESEEEEDDGGDEEDSSEESEEE